MEYIEVIISFIIGLAITGLLGIIFSLKTKGLIRLLINSAIGCLLLFILSLFNVKPFALNPLSAFIVGLLGIPGLAAIYIILMFL